MATPSKDPVAEVEARIERLHEILFGLIVATVGVGLSRVIRLDQTQVWRAQRLAQTNRLSNRARSEVAKSLDEVSKLIPQVVDESMTLGREWAEAQAEVLEEAKPFLTVGGGGSPQTISTGSGVGATTTRDKMIKELTKELTDTHNQMLRQVPLLYRDVVEGSLSKMVRGENTLQEAVWESVRQYSKRGLPGFIDRSGRLWQPETYSDMVLRTIYSRAYTQSKIDTLVERGQDLVIVSDSPEECPLCRPWEGQILSIGGSVVPPAVGTVEQARSAGLFHPRCTHTVDGWVEGLTVPKPPKANPEGYRLSQKQRGLERRVREAKRELAGADSVGDKQAYYRASKKRADRQRSLNEFLADTGRIPRSGATLISPPKKRVKK